MRALQSSTNKGLPTFFSCLPEWLTLYQCDVAPEAAGLPCSTCTSVKKDSRKIIHNLPCRRWKLTEISLDRPGFLGFTRRFSHRQMGDIDGVGPRVRVGISVDPGKPVLAVEVHRFVPIPGDVTSRRYISNGTYKYVEIPPYCLADINQTAKAFRDHVEGNALHSLRGAAEEAAKDGNVILSRTFFRIYEHISGLQVSPNPYSRCLQLLNRTWGCCRQMGKNTLSCGLP